MPIGRPRSSTHVPNNNTTNNTANTANNNATGNVFVPTSPYFAFGKKITILLKFNIQIFSLWLPVGSDASYVPTSAASPNLYRSPLRTRTKYNVGDWIGLI